MYVHTHWAYNHPYAARTWTLKDWEGYLAGLATLGYDMVMVWPLCDSMPPELTRSDREFLDTIAEVIDLAHARFGMKVAVTSTPNIIGNERASEYAFSSRPYFICEKKVNPGNETDVAAFLEGRRNQFRYLRDADALVIIDSDPGGYAGSTNDEFVSLAKQQVSVFRGYNRSAEFIYWMLAGWESYNRFWAETAADPSGKTDMWANWKGEDFKETLSLMKEEIDEPWSVFSWLPEHRDAVRSLGMASKAMYFPYGVVEGEPAFPLTNCNSEAVADTLASEAVTECPHGVMANAQTHCLQLPHTYMFAHFAKGGTREQLDLAQFADDLLPECGDIVAGAWSAIEERDGGRQTVSAEKIRALIGRGHPEGRLRGLLFADADRFLEDLAMNLDVRTSLLDFGVAVQAGNEPARALRRTLDCLRPYQERLGFVDAYAGPLHTEFNNELARLGAPRLNDVLKLFSDWRVPSVRHGLAARLLDAAEVYCEEQGL